MIIKACATMLAASFTTGCTIVELSGAKRVDHVGIGVLRIVPQDGVRMVSSKTRGFGIVPTTRGATIGYVSEDAAFQYDEACSVVIFELPKGEPEREFWKQIILAESKVCVVGEEGK